MVWRVVAIQKTRTVSNGGRSKSAARKIKHQTGAQRMALIVIEQEEISRWREVSQPASDRTLSFKFLPRISQMKSAMAKQERRARRNFQCSNARPINGQGKENIRVAELVVIEIISHTRTEII